MPDLKLENIDPEDIGDVLERLEKSFGFKYGEESLKKAKTFGEICDITEKHINLEHRDDCTSQQAFYKIRKALGLTLEIDGNKIEPSTRLEDLFPRKNRIQDLEKLQKNLELDLDILRMKKWLFWTIFSGFCLFLLTFFVNWVIALSGITFFLIFSKVASKFSRELDLKTIGQLTEKVSRENYLAIRRFKGTMNRNEIPNTIQDCFANDLSINKKYLTKDAPL